MRLAGGCFWGLQALIRGLPGVVVTEIRPAGPFWDAEPEHQDYLERHPNGYTCHFVRPDWVLPPP
jgi:peptide-methionine (S)-S-oxide reductase